MERSEFLATIPIFSSLSKSQLEEMAASWKVVEKKTNDIIFNKGDEANTIYIVQEGMINILIRSVDGEDLTLTTLKSADLFGELTLFDKQERTATAIAGGDTILLEMPRKTFLDFLKKYPDIAINLLSILSTRLRETNALIEKQVTRNVNEELENEMTFPDKIADKLSVFIGSWKFIFLFSGVLVGWITLNTYVLIANPPDHYPFTLLNLLLSCLAAFQAPVIMMSQGRQAKKDHISADLDYKINLKAELQIEQILIRLDRLSHDMEKLKLYK